jgi:ABC-2 type transport system permease protein
MSADTAALPAALRPRAPALRRLTLTELTLFIRERVGIIWGIGFPLVLLIIFGNIPAFRKPVSPAAPRVSILDSYVPILLAFVLAMIALNVLPPMLAGYRENGVLRRLSATPGGAVRVLAAQLIVDAGMTTVTMIALLVVARLAFSVAFPRQSAEFALAVVLGALALLSLGLLLASVLPTSRGANAAGAILFFPMTFFAGLWLLWHPLYLLILAGYLVAFAVAAARLTLANEAAPQPRPTPVSASREPPGESKRREARI